MNVTEILANPLSQQLLASAIPARFASTALDGDPSWCCVRSSTDPDVDCAEWRRNDRVGQRHGTAAVSLAV